VRRKLNRRVRFCAQLVCEGHPYQKAKNTLGQGVTGIDIGPSTLAVVTEAAATLEKFCEELEPIQPAICKLQRKLDRQRRAGDPQNYNKDGTIKQGVKLEWHFSRRYVYTREQMAELYRKQAAYRKSLHGRKANQILRLGNVIKMEGLSYRAFQRMFGKSVGFRGPGTFVALLRRKAANAGAEVDEFSTQTTRLSQVCLCGAIAKKNAVAPLACVRLWRGANPARHFLRVAGPLCGEQQARCGPGASRLAGCGLVPAGGIERNSTGDGPGATQTQPCGYASSARSESVVRTFW